jgi:hypothetical protein
MTKQHDTKYLASLKARYAKANKKERSKILDEFVATTGYHRKYAIAVLRGKRQRVREPIRRPRRAYYTAEYAHTILVLADLFDHICSKRLRAAMDQELDQLYTRGFLRISKACYERLQRISPATMDRLRARYGRRQGTARGMTKPGTLLKSQIPVRTWAQWDEGRPGFCEIDLVDHSGGNTRGDHAWTLTFTDVKTGWTECVAVRNKAQKYVFAAIQRVRERLPFPLLGLDSDNGSEFINDELFRYCCREQITFTRGRAGRKNDNAYVEQKNWSVVRRTVGYRRYDSFRHLLLLNRLYSVLRFYVNFFLPVMKLVKKERLGSRVKKTYDQPQTPCARVLAHPDVSAEDKDTLRTAYQALDVVLLRQQLDDLLDQLWSQPEVADYVAPVSDGVSSPDTI